MARIPLETAIQRKNPNPNPKGGECRRPLFSLFFPSLKGGKLRKPKIRQTVAMSAQAAELSRVLETEEKLKMP